MTTQSDYGLSTDTTLGGNSPSDIISSSEKAVKTYVDGRTISDLNGVDITTTTLTTGQTLEYDGTKWVNVTNTANYALTFRDWDEA